MFLMIAWKVCALGKLCHSQKTIVRAGRPGPWETAHPPDLYQGNKARSPSLLFKRVLTLSQRRSGSPSPGQGGSHVWRSGASDPYKIQAKVLPEKFKRISGCYPRQLTLQERKAHDNELSALLAEGHPLNLRNESVHLRWKRLRKNFKGFQRILRSLLLGRDIWKTPWQTPGPKEGSTLGHAGWRCGAQGLGQELLPCRTTPRSQPFTEHRKKGLAFDPTFCAPSSPRPLVPREEVLGVLGPGERGLSFLRFQNGRKELPRSPPHELHPNSALPD